MRRNTNELSGRLIQTLRLFTGVTLVALSAWTAPSFAQASSADMEALIDKCFEEKVAETRRLGGSVVGTMIPALLSECKTEIESAKNSTSGTKASATASPSFDCKKATTRVEKLICANPELSNLDAVLAELYKEAVSKDRSIRDDQRAWNTEKNKCADVDCLKTAYQDRNSELVNFIVRFDRAALNQGQAQAPAPRNLSTAERLAIQLGPNKNAGCLSVSMKYIGLLSGGAPGSELANARNLYIRYAEVFVGVSKLQDKSQFDAQMNGFRESVKQASPQDIKGYFESNCSQPEVNQLVQSGWK
jgi:uncharacterized protein YecT (DUF1311 family)